MRETVAPAADGSATPTPPGNTPPAEQRSGSTPPDERPGNTTQGKQPPALSVQEITALLGVIVSVAAAFVTEFGAARYEQLQKRLGLGASVFQRSPVDDLRDAAAAASGPSTWYFVGLFGTLMIYALLVSTINRYMTRKHASRIFKTLAWLLAAAGMLGVMATAFDLTRQPAATAGRPTVIPPEPTKLYGIAPLWLVCVLSFLVLVGAWSIWSQVRARLDDTGISRNVRSPIQDDYLRRLRRTAAAAAVVAAVFTLMVAFIETAAAARVVGNADADSFYNGLQDNTQPVVVFSAKDLSLGDDADQVTCKTIDQENSVYQFSCSGLRFYRYDRGRYFLVTNGFTPGNSRIVILAEAEGDAAWISPDIRIEFVTRNGLSNETPTAPAPS